MPPDSSAGRAISPEDAFSLLGNEIRIDILRALAETEPRRFSELRAATDVADSGKFNYHLNQLTDHFVERREDGYRLSRPGRRVIQAVVSGAVTDAPEIERTAIDWRCHLCGDGPLELDYRDEQIGVYCPHCAGLYGGEDGVEEPSRPADRERLYYMHLPPAGLAGRSPEAVMLAGARWSIAETVTAASGICPRCAAAIVESATVCRSHTAEAGRCSACDNRFAVMHRARCPNCGFELESVFVNKLLTDLEFRRFLMDHGANPVFPRSHRFLELVHGYEETVRSADPLEVRFRFEAGKETLTVVVDDSLSVASITRERDTAGTDGQR